MKKLYYYYTFENSISLGCRYLYSFKNKIIVTVRILFYILVLVLDSYHQVLSFGVINMECDKYVQHCLYVYIYLEMDRY